MLRQWLLLTCCIVAIACLFEDVEGSRRCLMRCKFRCKTLQNKSHRTAYWTCARKCSRMALTCESCFGPRQCLKCASGYKQSSGSYCVADIKSCSTNNGGCSAGAVCTGDPGSVNCTCNPGFTGNGKKCNDVDECATDYGGCSTNAICANSIGSFTCTCNTGYTGNGINCTGSAMITENVDGADIIVYQMYIHPDGSDSFVYFSPASQYEEFQSTFLVLPCLAPNALATAPASRCVSFMPEFLPGYYIRAKLTEPTPEDSSPPYSLHYEENINDATFNQDASFIMHKDLFKPGGYVSFQSVSYQTLYINAANDGQLVIPGWINPSGYLFKDTASFKLVPTWSPSYIPLIFED